VNSALGSELLDHLVDHGGRLSILASMEALGPSDALPENLADALLAALVALDVGDGLTVQPLGAQRGSRPPLLLGSVIHEELQAERTRILDCTEDLEWRGIDAVGSSGV
jgi:hypothetical protein